MSNSTWFAIFVSSNVLLVYATKWTETNDSKGKMCVVSETCYFLGENRNIAIHSFPKGFRELEWSLLTQAVLIVSDDTNQFQETS